MFREKLSLELPEGLLVRSDADQCFQGFQGLAGQLVFEVVIKNPPQVGCGVGEELFLAVDLGDFQVGVEVIGIIVEDFLVGGDGQRYEIVFEIEPGVGQIGLLSFFFSPRSW